MTTMPVTRWHLSTGARGLIGWTVGLVAVLLLYLPVYPSMSGAALDDLIGSMPPALVDAMGLDKVTTGAGYTQASFFDLTGYLLGGLACTVWGAQLIAGHEETGRLELTLAHAVGRTQYAWESLATLVLRMLMLAAVTAGVILLLNGPSELSLRPGPTLMATLVWTMLCLLSGVTALSVGTATGRQAWAVGAGVVVTVLGYVLDAVSRSSQSLEWLARLSPAHWAYGADPLTTGQGWPGVALLGAVSGAMFVVGGLLFTRRDIHG